MPTSDGDLIGNIPWGIFAREYHGLHRVVSTEPTQIIPDFTPESLKTSQAMQSLTSSVCGSELLWSHMSRPLGSPGASKGGKLGGWMGIWRVAGTSRKALSPSKVHEGSSQKSVDERAIDLIKSSTYASHHAVLIVTAHLADNSPGYT